MEGVGLHREKISHVTAVSAHHDVFAFAETIITPYLNFLPERFSFNRGKRPRSDWQVDTVMYRRMSGGRETQSCRHVTCAAPHTIAALFAALSNSTS